MLKARNVVWGLMVFVNTYHAFAQKKRFSILPFPVVYYTPETRWAYGAALTSTFRFRGDSANARPSQVSLGVVFTQQKQSLYYLPFQVFLKNAGYYFYGEIGFYRYNYFYFGIGNQLVPKELYGVDYPRIKLNFLKKIYPHLYAGVRYQYEDYQITQTEPKGVFAKGNVPGTPRGRTSGVGLGLFKLLPAGSISGAPKPRTLDIIQEAEEYVRGYYTGVTGIFDGENLDSGVLIRFIEKKDNQLIFKSGGGITARSEVHSEYQEIIDKVYLPILNEPTSFHRNHSLGRRAIV